ncbi:hypothetical protein PGT21_019533 [Puccinia graminis f. sp. tritici]|uniref:RING-type domain-containing protein n=2 Tax=Puccinia graminis f. sp. tritici TaxID=56615 RepID=E3L5B8_PUCGT|nr:uncharacterized protein PGTG_17480 [Puccinia graminis f. sp. tritici CRL 75-36-700-3]EFP91743.2 hypothetical protein PGTG_17480 [Puccinia graminis f. sp. tritici CRL 75-36-700-3]KAA1101422.1 hypothetical protein PGT21_019533 [Puccinia graminis f. sp. tritici]
MPALPSDYSLFTSVNDHDHSLSHRLTDHLIPQAYFYNHPDRTNTPPAESLNHRDRASFDTCSLLKQRDSFQQPASGILRQPESFSQGKNNNTLKISESDLKSNTTHNNWENRMTDETLEPAPSPQEDFYKDLDQLGILDYLQDYPVSSDDQYFDQFHGLDWLELQTDRQKPLELSSFDRTVTGQAILKNPSLTIQQQQQIPETENPHRVISCSSCGVTKPQIELSRLWPCCHPHCNTCINTLINASCNDPPPPQMVCFFCSQHVDGFDPPSAFLSAHNTLFGRVNHSTGLPPFRANQKFFSSGLDRFESVNYNASPPSDQSGLCTGSFSSVWSPNPQLINETDKLVSTFMSDDSNIPLQSGPGNPCPWPIVRVDNISWSLTVADIVSWLPGGVECLPPPELCPLPIHILCTPTDGKTLNHCFIETRNLTAAHFIVRHRHGTKIGIRPCSVVLTSSAELHSKILGTKENETSHDIMKTVRLILKLCAPHSTSSIKSPERPFYHLMSLLSHSVHLSEGGCTKAEDPGEIEVVEKWTNILQIALESLFGWKIENSDSLNILHLMVNVAIVSSLIDKPTLFRFLSHVEVFY